MTIALALIGMLYLGLFLGVLVMSICAAAGSGESEALLRVAKGDFMSAHLERQRLRKELDEMQEDYFSYRRQSDFWYEQYKCLAGRCAKLEALQRAEQPRPEQCEGIADDEHVIDGRMFREDGMHVGGARWGYDGSFSIGPRQQAETEP